MLLLIFGIFSFIGLVLIHEWGHYIAARKSGVTVEEYGVGFPPKLYGKVLGKHKTLYTINALPLGGFVRLKGEHDMDTEPGAFGRASLLQKLVIIGAGVAMNVLTAFVLLTILAFVGMNHIKGIEYKAYSDMQITNDVLIVGAVTPGTPSADSGLQPYDRILRVSASSDCTQNCSIDFTGKDVITDKYELYKKTTTESLPGQKVVISYWRPSTNTFGETTMQLRSQAEVDAITEKNATLPDDQKTSPAYSGVIPMQYRVSKYGKSAPLVAANVSVGIVKLTFQGLRDLVVKSAQGDTAAATEKVSGPLGVFFVLKEGSVFGLRFVLFIIAVISLSLAIMNVLPIPALDGGRLFVILLFHGLSKVRQRFQGKPLLLKQKTEDIIHGTGFVFMMVLFVLITIVDIGRFF